MGTWYAKSLNEYIRIIGSISQKHKDTENRNILWFRGHEQTDIYYYLEPNIYRNISSKKEKNNINSEKTYGTLWLKEEYRYQHFAARNYDKIENMPESMIEWQEIMQHYFSKTRLMDWSESAIVALNFALEAYVNPLEDHEILYKRRHNAPVIWVLNPIELNRKVYDCFKKDSNLVSDAMKNIDIDQADVERIIFEIQEHEEYYFWLNNNENSGVNGLVSLSGLEFLRKSYSGSLEQAIKSGSFNPFFYLLLRYYSDGLAVTTDKLPPLAIIHPHHSPRIHEQKGAFTIFPYYYVEEKTKKMHPFAMEFMPKCKSCLEKIIVMDAKGMAEQLKEIGVKRSHLYPEMEIVTKDFEYMK